ncbi:DgyrCDS10118 [Dimorphilus gyrociliatus]|uniref:Mitochondrial basic amino acids transporter n=1 Tax=Dimorphilus gyrociliatus TaxID=2664684 RepID=A0A7I8W197_9ANNE|nr:DgyrCDS10118 [Dimorphilus gyrociliatus]
MALDFFAGCIGGITGVIVGHPFDTVKVRLQTQNPIIYKGTFDCFAQIIKKESFIGLYKGIAPPLCGLTAINAIVFGVQGNVQRRLPKPNSLTAHYLAGAVAGFSQCVICSPMELVKTRLQVQGQGQSRKIKQTLYKNSYDCLVKIFKKEGIKGVYRGFWLTTLRETPSFGVYFASYEKFCRIGNPSEVGTMQLLLSGGTAGMCSWIVTYPFDVIKSRVQADVRNEYKGLVDCFRKSIASEGWLVLTKGLGSTLLRAFPVNATTFATVTYVFRFASRHTEYFDSDETNIQEFLQHSSNQTGHLALLTNFPSHP